MNGLLNTLFPFFNALDAAMAGLLPAWARLVVFGTASGALTMALYSLVSNQKAIRGHKDRMRTLQRELKAAQDDFQKTMRLTRQNLTNALAMLGRVIGPALISSLPVVFVIAWLATHWSYALPRPGTPIAAAFEPPAASATLVLEDAADADNALLWPEPEVRLALHEDGAVLWNGSAAALAATGSVHKPLWWNALLGNPAGYLPKAAELEAFRVALPSLEVLGFGPGWIRGWEFTYFLTVVVVSLSIKIAFKIA